MKILIAEDEVAMQKIIALYLTREGYEVKTVSNGQEAIEMLYEEKFDLVILDWMMPELSGLEVCQEIHRLGISVKILMLTAKSEIEDELRGLGEGADDYIRKPFDPRVLMVRIKKLIQEQKTLRCGNIQLYPERGVVVVDGMTVALSQTEQKLLTYLIENQGIILSREQLLSHVWGIDYEGDDRTLDTHIRRLRRKIGEDAIRTHRGIGYGMRSEHE